MRIRKSYLFWLLLLSCKGATAQDKGHPWHVSAGALQPIGVFSETHFTGASVRMDYYPGRPDSSKQSVRKKWGWVLSSGVAYFPGRKRTVSGYPFRYGNYGIWHTSGGILYQPIRKMRISLTAGPALSYYRKDFRFNIGAESGISWYWNPRWGAGTTIVCWKESGADLLWMIGLRGFYAF